MNLAELLAIPSSMYPEREIVRFEGQTTSYGALQDQVGRTAGALRSLGVRAGDRVAVLQTNTPEAIVAMYAAATIGAIFVPLNYRARVAELAYMLGLAKPQLLLAGDRYLDIAREANSARGGSAQVVALGMHPDGAPCLEALAEGADEATPEDVGDDDLAVLLFTSGTTAAPKAVMLAHADLVSFVFATTDPADGSDRGSVLLAAPLYHVAGLSAVLTSMFAGRRIVLMRQFDPAEWLRTAEAERITHGFLVPTMLRRVLDHPSFSSTDLSSLQVLSYGAAPMPLRVIRRAIEALPPSVQLVGAFGQTETTATVTVLAPEDHRLEGTPEQIEKRLQRLRSVGRPLPDVELSVLDEGGATLPSGEIGEIAIRTSRSARGYYGEPQAAGGPRPDAWLRTGDLGWVDGDGYVYLTGRKSDLIIRGGENIAPEEVEAVLESHPAVQEAAVVAVPDEEWGERVAAAVVRAPGAEVSAEALIELCRQRLASFKKPEALLFVDVLPRNAVGKVLRSELRARHEGEFRPNGGVNGEPDG